MSIGLPPLPSMTLDEIFDSEPSDNTNSKFLIYDIYLIDKKFQFNFLIILAISVLTCAKECFKLN